MATGCLMSEMTQQAGITPTQEAQSSDGYSWSGQCWQAQRVQHCFACLACLVAHTCRRIQLRILYTALCCHLMQCTHTRGICQHGCPQSTVASGAVLHRQPASLCWPSLFAAPSTPPRDTRASWAISSACGRGRHTSTYISCTRAIRFSSLNPSYMPPVQATRSSRTNVLSCLILQVAHLSA